MLERIIKKPTFIGIDNIPNISKGLSSSVYKFVKSGFVVASDDVLRSRMDCCNNCEFWNKASFNGTGKCNKCGCSTWAKLRMATERCPLGKWESVNLEEKTN